MTSGTFLVSSAIEATWPKDQPCVFLGSWCLRYSRKSVWSQLDYEILDYRWDDRSALVTDFMRIEELYELLLPEVAKELNRVHAVNHTVNYWRIVVGWWLFYFTQVFFDRWQVVVAADSAFPDATLRRLPAENQFPASNDTASFIQELLNDSWNERLFADICESHTGIRVMTVDEPKRGALSPRQPGIEVDERAATSSADRLPGRVAIHADYLPRWKKAKLALLLGQLPSRRPIVAVPITEADPSWRAWSLPCPVDDPFSRALVEAVPRYLPLCYLEGYAEAVQRASTTYTARPQRVIMTENSFATDEIWKMWAAAQCDDGSKLVIAQHGGHYGTGAWSASQTHELAISDRYLSWGWSDPTEPQVWPAPATRLVGAHRRKPRRRGRCLQVVTTVPRQSYWMFSAPVGPQLERYLEDQITFAGALSSDVRADLLVRLDRNDYGWDQAERWQDADPEVCLDDGSRALGELLDDTRLYVATYNATTFLESFTQGIPTVMFWNPEYWELSESAKPFF
ncbi:MAG: LIC12162 family transferase, partial [Limisphaerales bacterium]